MYNDFSGFDKNGKPIKISIPPTLLISSIGILDDVTKAVTIDLKFPGDSIYILGQTFDELCGSEFFAMQNWEMFGDVPKVNAKQNKKLYEEYYKAIQKEIIASAISINIGGLGVALAKTAMAGKLGIDISLWKLPGDVRHNSALFTESSGRILVSINPKNEKEFEKIFKSSQIAKIGSVRKDNKIMISGIKNESIVSTTVDKALENYRSTFKGY
jgi:phosphoribosylformylglycinamidine (FGAM) synthase-like enzyme